MASWMFWNICAQVMKYAHLDLTHSFLSSIDALCRVTQVSKSPIPCAKCKTAKKIFFGYGKGGAFAPIAPPLDPPVTIIGY